MAVGILLHIFAMTNSDLGLDAHVRLNAAMDGQHDGQDLAWGKLRVGNSSEQAPTHEQVYDGYIVPWFESEFAAKFTAFAGVLGVACLAGFSPRGDNRSLPFDPVKPALLLLSPIFLFVSARGYDEGVLSLVAGFGAVGFLFIQGDERAQRLLHVVMMAVSVMLLLGWKGFSPVASIGAFLLTVALGAGWVIVEEKSTGSFGAWLVHPWKMAVSCAAAVFIAVMTLGMLTETGTFAIIGQQPVTFVLATLVASIHSILLFLLVGFVLWPLLSVRWSSLSNLRGAGPTMLASYIAVILAGIAAYIGALWTLESQLWDRSLAETMLVLGNNGRYATAVLLPLVFLLSWPIDDEEPNLAQDENNRIRVGLLVLVPLMLFVSFYGQQLWSDDAGAWLADSMEDDETCFVMVAQETLAMHHLYVIKSNVDLNGEQGIDGYWRSAIHVEEFVDTNPDCAELMIIAPGEDYAPGEAWALINEQAAPYTLSGGAHAGSWKVFRAIE
ncbi:MAG: hypothetical protein VW102_05570 [Poseidonia sp.]|jgi:hypothetical protein